MYVTYWGHSTYSVETSDRHFIIDPLFEDVFQFGTASVFPGRTIDRDHMPHFDAIFITHCHPGHLEFTSLSWLPVETPVFYPDDPTIELVLKELGFANRHTVGPNTILGIGDVTVTVTASDAEYPELGFLFEEAGGKKCWYLGDTIVNSSIIQGLGDQASGIDLLIANYPGYHEFFFKDFTLELPLEEYASKLEAITRINARICCVDYVGLKYRAPAEWINALMFPVRKKDFLQRIRHLRPAMQTLEFTPGLSLNIADGAISKRYAQCIRPLPPGEKESLYFDPTNGFLPLGAQIADMPYTGADYQDALAFLQDEWLPWVRQATGHKLLAQYRRLKLDYKLVLVFPGGLPPVAYLVNFGDEAPQLKRVDESEPAAMTHRIAVNVLSQWIKAEVPYYYVYCFSRFSGRFVACGELDDGSISSGRLRLRDPLSLYLSGTLDKTYHPWIKEQIRKIPGKRAYEANPLS